MNSVFILGQYKCGTTWLLTALGAHPQVMAVDEIDLVALACRREGSEYVLKPVEERIKGVFEQNAWCSHHDGTAWRTYLDELRRGDDNHFTAWNGILPKKIIHMRPSVTARLYERVREATAPQMVLSGFLDAVCDGAEKQTHIVLKACGQIGDAAAIRGWQPDAQCIVITRDGRDAALSAYHFEQLMKSQNAPFKIGDNDYWSLLQYWASQAELAAKLWHQGSVTLLRYEDLTHDFRGSFGGLLEQLGLDASDDIIDTINDRTSFEATTGRKRGVEEKQFRRKGAVGEWCDVLSPEDKEKAWAMAGTALAAFGYSRGRELNPLRRPEGVNLGD